MKGRLAVLLLLMAVAFMTVVRPRAVEAGPGLVNVTVDDGQLIQRNFRGLGFQLSAHLAPISKTEMAEVFSKRWHQIDPDHALIAHTKEWDWARVVPFLKTVLNRSDIWLTHLPPAGSDPGTLPEAGEVVTVLKRLVRKEGVTNVTAYCVNARWPGVPHRADAGPSAGQLGAFCGELSKKLKAAGHDTRKPRARIRRQRQVAGRAH